MRGSCFEDRSEDGEGRGAGCGLDYLCWRVTGDPNQRISWGGGAGRAGPELAEGSARPTLCACCSDFLRADVIRAEMDAVGLDSKGNISAGVDEQSSSQFSVLSSQLRTFVDDAHHLSRQGFQFARGEIFFPKLD